jgi:hypothetical protein
MINDEMDQVMRGFFVMVSRDPKTYKAAPLNPLLLECEVDHKLFQEAQGTALGLLCQPSDRATNDQTPWLGRYH